MQLFNLLFTVLSLLSVSVNAFGFFDQMFGQQQQQQQQQQQNVRSDSSWYQAQYEAGMYLSTLLASLSPFVYHSSNCYLKLYADANDTQHTAQTISALEPSPAYISLTTVLAHGRLLRIRRNLAMGLRFVRQRVDIRLVRRQRRLSWRGRDCYERC